ncbi:MAG: Asp23/Gls24 family envelope stress response protein [Clostridia bacterium]|nr:Asp23/Gls24 family envelope stress response protein [Clostridia bacterium]
MKVIETEAGKLAFSEETVAAVAVWKASQVPGVVRVSGQGEGLANLFGRDRLPKGVSVDIRGDEVFVELDVVVRYGVDIQRTARATIAAVHDGIREALGFDVADVRVNVVGVEPLR